MEFRKQQTEIKSKRKKTNYLISYQSDKKTILTVDLYAFKIDNIFEDIDLPLS